MKYKLYRWAANGNPYGKVSERFVEEMGGPEAFDMHDAASYYKIIDDQDPDFVYIKLKYPNLTLYPITTTLICSIKDYEL